MKQTVGTEWRNIEKRRICSRGRVKIFGYGNGTLVAQWRYGFITPSIQFVTFTGWTLGGVDQGAFYPRASLGESLRDSLEFGIY